MQVKRFEDSWQAVIALERNFVGTEKRGGFKTATSSRDANSIGIGEFSDPTAEIQRSGTT